MESPSPIVAKIKKINAILEKGEPENISEDPYTHYTGYKPQYIIDAMNSVLFGEWGFREIQTHTLKEVKKTKDGLKDLAVAQVEVWLKGVDFKPVGWGQANVTKGDYGDAKKGAQTDAIKKALSYFSIGNRAYHGKLKV